MIEKKEEKLVLAILSKLGPNYSMFASNFHPTKLTARYWKMPKITEFMESLTQEQDKLVMMGTIKPSKDQALVVLRPGNLQETTDRDSPQPTFPTSPLTVWYRESIRFVVRLPYVKVTKTKALPVAARCTVYIFVFFDLKYDMQVPI